jgi:molybdopterin converting factor small subunit
MIVSSETPSIRIRLFARYAELLGRDAFEVAPGGIGSVADVVALVRALPGGAALPERPLAAVNLEQASLDHAVGPGDEVALLPPLAGG